MCFHLYPTAQCKGCKILSYTVDHVQFGSLGLLTQIMTDVLSLAGYAFKIKQKTVKYETYLDRGVFAQYRPSVNEVQEERFLDSLTLLLTSCLIKRYFYFSRGAQLQQEQTDGISFDGY